MSESELFRMSDVTPQSPGQSTPAGAPATEPSEDGEPADKRQSVSSIEQIIVRVTGNVMAPAKTH